MGFTSVREVPTHLIVDLTASFVQRTTGLKTDDETKQELEFDLDELRNNLSNRNWVHDKWFEKIDFFT
jgi:hypothetical protein